MSAATHASEHAQLLRLTKENKALQSQLNASFNALNGYLEANSSLEIKRKPFDRQALA